MEWTHPLYRRRHRVRQHERCLSFHTNRGDGSLSDITTIGIDLAKSVFQLHGVGKCGATVLRKKVRRAQLLRLNAQWPPCLIGLEACRGAHHCAREHQDLQSAHRIREGLVRERTALIDRLRGLLGEYGVVVAKNAASVRRALLQMLQDAEQGLPVVARQLLSRMYEDLH